VERQRVGTSLLLFLAAAALPQDTLATVTGSVRSSRDGQAIGGVMVSVRGAGTSAFNVTDSTGRFRITRLPPASYTLRIAFAEHVTEDYRVNLRPGQTMDLSILLDVQGTELAPIVVEAASQEYALSLAGFYARREHGLGRFVTHADIERRHPANLSQMLAGTGITMRCVRTACAPVRSSSGRRCFISVFLDGVRVENYNIDGIPPEDVLGLEVYRQGSDTPAEFSHFSADCGALVIWTKN
jgi:Carboxypeptidase regulatory-like domain